MKSKEWDAYNVSNLIDFRLLIVPPIGVGRTTLRRIHQTFLAAERASQISLISSLAYCTRKFRHIVAVVVEIVDVPVAGIAHLLILVHLIVVCTDKSQASFAFRLHLTIRNAPVAIQYVVAQTYGVLRLGIGSGGGEVLKHVLRRQRNTTIASDGVNVEVA